MIGYWHHHVNPLSVCLSIYNAVDCGSQGRCAELKVVPACSYSRQVPIFPFRHFCCRTYV